MEPNETAPAAAPSQDVDLSRRRLLLGAAAGALTAPLLRASSAEAGVAWLDDGNLVREPAGSPIGGVWSTRFKRVRDEFIRNFSERGEVGASGSVIAGGRNVIHLWGSPAR